jgi:hypothetical protein
VENSDFVTGNRFGDGASLSEPDALAGAGQRRVEILQGHLELPAKNVELEGKRITWAVREDVSAGPIFSSRAPYRTVGSNKHEIFQQNIHCVLGCRNSWL